MDRLEQRVDQLESTVKSRDAEIDRLNRELANRPLAPAQPPTSTGTLPTSAPADQGLSDIDKTTSDMLKDIQAKEIAPPTMRFPANFNPNFAVIGDFAGNYSSDHSDPRETTTIYARLSWICVPRWILGRMPLSFSRLIAT